MHTAARPIFRGNICRSEIILQQIAQEANHDAEIDEKEVSQDWKTFPVGEFLKESGCQDTRWKCTTNSQVCDTPPPSRKTLQGR